MNDKIINDKKVLKTGKVLDMIAKIQIYTDDSWIEEVITQSKEGYFFEVDQVDGVIAIYKIKEESQ